MSEQNDNSAGVLKRKNARPTTYTAEVGQQICDAIANGATLDAAARQANVKAPTFLLWCHVHAELAEEYVRARQRQNEAVDDQIRALVAEVNEDNARSTETKFRMLTWIAGKRAPKQFGERVGVEHSGKNGGPIAMELVVRDVADES